MRPSSASSTQNDVLFCIPHAGGSAAYYTKFKPYCREQYIDLHPLELPGRGRRSRETRKTNLESMCQDLLPTMIPTAKAAAPYAIFGHSMGARLAFLCTAELHKQNLPLPNALFVSACPPPHLPASPLPVSVTSLPPDELWHHIIALGNIPEDLATSREFRQYLEPILYADLLAIENSKPDALPQLPVPITVLLGDQDNITHSAARQWQQLTTRPLTVHSLPGNHFYLQNHWQKLAALIRQNMTAMP